MILEYDKNELANFSSINVQGIQLTKDPKYEISHLFFAKFF